MPRRQGMEAVTLWTRPWPLVAAAGFTASWLLWGTSLAMDLWVVLTVSSLMFIIATSESAGKSAPASVRRGRAVSQSVLIGAGLVAFMAIAAISRPLVGAFVVLAVVISSLALGWSWAPSARETEPRVHEVAGRASAEPEGLQDAPPLSQLPARFSVQDLTDDELCYEWRRSFVLLKRAQFPNEFARIAALRGLLMEELERRSPSGIDAWLSSGARAAGGPERYLEAERQNAAPSQAHPDAAGSDSSVDDSVDNEAHHRELDEPRDTGDSAA